MMIYSDIKDALEILGLPQMITKDDIKKQYRHIAKKLHPDRGGEKEELQKLNDAYALLINYIDHFKFTFDEDEIKKQLPSLAHLENFRV